MSGYLAVALVTVGAAALGRCVVGVVAILRADRKDIPDVVRALSRTGPGEDGHNPARQHGPKPASSQPQ